MSAIIIDGKAIAQSVRTRVKEDIVALQTKFPHFQPHLAMIQVGDRDDSSIYVRMKDKAAKEIGIKTTMERMPETTSQAELMAKIHQLNTDNSVHGILVQMPLPSHMDETAVIESIDYRKDVDGFHIVNTGNLAKKAGQPLFLPCTPKGIIEILKSTGVQISGKHAVVVGRSDLVGAPVSMLLMAEDATVTVCHSKTKNLEQMVKQADILVVAVGKTELIKGDWIKPGAVVIDVGTNSVPDATKKSGMRWVGDVEYAKAKEVAYAITPVPGGVGPLTVAMLMENTLISAKRWFNDGN
ncbi:tetrahydrofolate synthase [Apophysomyces sp. BC1015]|nr:tetrahydrofolate synthase [Apophysomyces sp. BC1015]KAG0177067.1 tetrahydrofolate synthase [Apophysomyces sp. BC1021]